MNDTCLGCGFTGEFIIAGTDTLVCPRCYWNLPVTVEEFRIGGKLEQIDSTQHAKVLKEGTVVKIDHRDHVWHNEIAVVCGIKHKFYRLEFRGKKTWVPFEWVQEHEPS